MYGYDLISGTGPACAMSAILITASFFLLSLVQYWCYGMQEDVKDRDDLPIVSWVNINDRWVQVESIGAYSDYFPKQNYTYKWLMDKTSMGFVQDEPPKECTVLCSTGMRKAVDKILLTVPKERYK